MAEHVQPRPVRKAARVISAVASVFGLIPIVGTEFNWFEWTTGQINVYTLALGTFVGAASLVMGVQVEKVVTPTVSPRLDAETPLVPLQDTDPIV